MNEKAMKVLREALELCQRYEKENRDLQDMCQRLVDIAHKIRVEEREAMLTPNAN